MTDTTDRKIGPLPPPRRRRRIALLSAVAILVAGMAMWFAVKVFRTCGPFASGVYKVEGECIGVTDGSYIFQADLTNIDRLDGEQRRESEENAQGLVKVQELIAKENDRVQEESDNYVKVALLDPLNTSSQQVLPLGEIRNRLEGAYTALKQINGPPDATPDETRPPQIQLVLASEGSTNAQWQQVIGQLVEMSEQEDHPLVAVIGLGVSTKQTQDRANALSDSDIPMVSAYLTADQLNSNDIPGLIRISPGNRHYVEALRAYLTGNEFKKHLTEQYGTDTEFSSAMVVRDANSDEADLFTQSLEQNLWDQMGDFMKNFSSVQYAGNKIPGAPANANVFTHIRSHICSVAGPRHGLQVVFWAGREVDINPFLRSLEDRPCLGSPLTIATAGLDLARILEEWEGRLDAANLSVVFAGTVDVEDWKQHAAETPGGYPQFQSRFVSLGFDPEHLKGANAILMHDAVLAAAQAIQLAAVRENEDGSVTMLPITAEDVKVQLLNLHVDNAVPGASGTLNFTPDPPGKGDPICKPLPVLQYPRPDGSSQSRQVGELYFVRKDQAADAEDGGSLCGDS